MPESETPRTHRRGGGERNLVRALTTAVVDDGGVEPIPERIPYVPMGRPSKGRVNFPFAVSMPSSLHEWAMQHPEGLSALVRRLLLAEQERTREQPAD